MKIRAEVEINPCSSFYFFLGLSVNPKITGAPKTRIKKAYAQKFIFNPLSSYRHPFWLKVRFQTTSSPQQSGQQTQLSILSIVS